MSSFKDKAAPWIGVLAILGFGAFVIFLLRRLGAQEPQWSRMVFIFGAVEAAGLAALGFFFGKEVNRERAEKAEANADAATQAASTAEQGKVSSTEKLNALKAYIRTQSPTTAHGPAAILEGMDRILGRSGGAEQNQDLAAYISAVRPAASLNDPSAQWTALRTFAESL